MRRHGTGQTDPGGSKQPLHHFHHPITRDLRIIINLFDPPTLLTWIPIPFILKN
jgi:hypothetical protein